MTQNIGNIINQGPQQIWAPTQPGPEKQAASPTSKMYSYASYETLEITSINIDSSLTLFYSNLKDALAGILGFENSGNTFPYSNSDTPGGLAGRVLNHIQEEYANIGASSAFLAEDLGGDAMALSEEMPAEELDIPAEIPENTVLAGPAEDVVVTSIVDGAQEESLDDVETGINTGFQGTISQLAQAVYTEQSLQVVEEAEGLLQKGLQSLRNHGPERLPKQGDGFEMAGESVARDFNLEIMTVDGDRVMIEIGLDMESELVRYQYEDGGKKIRGKEMSGSLNDFLKVSIQGEVDPEEQRAISDLITEIAFLADTFYSGNFGDAFSQATELGFDTEELSGFTLDMNYERNAYTAFIDPGPLSEYENTQSARPAANNHLEALIEDAKKLADHPAFLLLENPMSVFNNIFQALSEQIASVSPEPVHQDQDLITRFMEEILAQNGSAEDIRTNRLNPPMSEPIHYWA